MLVVSSRIFLKNEGLQELYEADYEMGLAVKEQVISSAVLWFTGEIEDPFGGMEDDDGEDEEGEYDSAVILPFKYFDDNLGGRRL